MQSVKCVVGSAGCQKCSVKCDENVCLELRCNVIADRSYSWITAQQQVRTHAWTTTPGGRRAHASSINEKGLIVKSKATSAPPRAGTTGMCVLLTSNMEHTGTCMAWRKHRVQHKCVVIFAQFVFQL